MAEKENIFKRFAENRTANYIGAGVTVAGLFGAIAANRGIKSYDEATKDVQLSIGQVGVQAGERAKEAQASLTADLAGYEAATESGIKQGLISRGITDPKVAESATAQYKSGMYGAYAAAKVALSGAKMRASNTLNTAMSNYQMELSRKQYESQMQKYYSQMGIWGALGGIGGSIINMPSSKPMVQPEPSVSNVLDTKEGN